jgi:hypothetical protein
MGRQYEKAVAVLQKVIKMEPVALVCWEALMFSHEMYMHAIAEYQKIWTIRSSESSLELQLQPELEYARSAVAQTRVPSINVRRVADRSK